MAHKCTLHENVKTWEPESVFPRSVHPSISVLSYSIGLFWIHSRSLSECFNQIWFPLFRNHLSRRRERNGNFCCSPTFSAAAGEICSDGRKWVQQAFSPSRSSSSRICPSTALCLLISVHSLNYTPSLPWIWTSFLPAVVWFGENCVRFSVRTPTQTRILIWFADFCIDSH